MMLRNNHCKQGGLDVVCVWAPRVHKLGVYSFCNNSVERWPDPDRKQWNPVRGINADLAK